MKRKLLFAIVALMCSVGTWAQGWTAQAPANGDFYLYNVGSGKFLSCGSDYWGSHACIDNGALKFTFTDNESGAYTLYTTSIFSYGNPNSAQLQSSGYVDQSVAATTWKFDAVDGETNVYTMLNAAGTYLVAPSDGTKAIPEMTSDVPTTNYGYWKLINYANLFPETATESNPADITCLVGDANFESNQNVMEGFWTIAASNNNLAKAEGGTSIPNNVLESWRSTFTLSQTINVPNGFYRLRAQTFIREYTVTGADYPVVYITSGSSEKKSPFIAMNTTTASLGDVEGYFRNGDNGTDYFTAWTDLIKVTNGSITIGAKGTRTDTWCVMDNFQLQYAGPIDLTEYANALADAVSAAEAYEAQVPAAVYTYIASAITENNKEYATEDEYSAAIEAINTAVNTYATATIVADYTAYKSALGVRAKAVTTAALEDLASEEVTVLNNAISTADAAVDECTTAEALETAIAAQETNLWAAIAAAVESIELTEGDELDLTYLLTNPDLTSLPSWSGATGWYTEQTEGNSQVMNNEGATSEDGTKTKFYEYWSYTAQANNKFALYQKVTLPEGTYSIGCYAFAKQQDDPANTGDKRGVMFYANDTQGPAVYNSKLTEAGIDFINDETQEVKIGLKTISPNSYNWMGIGYVTLKKVPGSTTTYTITTSATNGSVAITVDGESATETIALKSVTLTVTPDEGYVLSSVAATYNDGASDVNLDLANPSTNVYTYQQPAYNVNVVVTFAVDKSALSTAIADATAAREEAYEGDGLFLIPTSAGTTFVSAITAAQSVYNNADATISEVAAAVTAITNAKTTYLAARQAPTEGQAYIIANTTADGVLNIATGSVTVGANSAVYFTAFGGGYVLSNADDEYIFKTTSNTWTLSTTEDQASAYVITSVNPVDGGFTIRGNNGLFGTDNTTSGSAVYANKAANQNGIWTISEAAVVNMNVAAGKWGTFIAPFEVTIPENVSAYTATGVNGSKVTLSDAIDTTIPANTPVLLKNEGEDAVDETFCSVSTATEDSYTEGLLTGVYTTATVPEGSYVLQTQNGTQAFYKVDAAFTATAYRAYLTAPAESNGVKALYFDFGGETAIKGVEAADMQNATIYNLAGQRVNKAQRSAQGDASHLKKGIYVVNGKKVAVK